MFAENRRFLAENRSKPQEAGQYLPKGCSRKMPLSFPSFQWGCLLEHSFLELFCLHQFSVIQGKLYMQRLSNTSFGRTLLVSNFGGLLLEQTFVGTLRPSQNRRFSQKSFCSTQRALFIPSKLSSTAKLRIWIPFCATGALLGPVTPFARSLFYASKQRLGAHRAL